jgi:hypothetical protein
MREHLCNPFMMKLYLEVEPHSCNATRLSRFCKWLLNTFGEEMSESVKDMIAYIQNGASIEDAFEMLDTPYYKHMLEHRQPSPELVRLQKGARLIPDTDNLVNPHYRLPQRQLERCGYCSVPFESSEVQCHHCGGARGGPG